MSSVGGYYAVVWQDNGSGAAANTSRTAWWSAGTITNSGIQADISDRYNVVLDRVLRCCRPVWYMYWFSWRTLFRQNKSLHIGYWFNCMIPCVPGCCAVVRTSPCRSFTNQYIKKIFWIQSFGTWLWLSWVTKLNNWTDELWTILTNLTYRWTNKPRKILSCC